MYIRKYQCRAPHQPPARSRHTMPGTRKITIEHMCMCMYAVEIEQVGARVGTMQRRSNKGVRDGDWLSKLETRLRDV